MNTLFYVRMVNEQRDWSTVFLLSASDETHLRLKAQALGLLGEPHEWTLDKFFPICATPDDVEEEIG